MYFFKYGAVETFTTFDITHIIVLVISTVLLSGLFIKRSKLKEINNKDKVSYILAGILLFLDFSFYFWKWRNGAQPYFPIPMHLCSWATYIVSLSLILKKDWLFQVGLYYGLTGGLLSLLVPEFGGYTYNHMRFYQFFMLHFMILSLPIYYFFTYEKVLKYKFIYITLGVMWIQAFLAFGVNKLTEQWTGELGNGMFVNEPPVDLPGFLGQTPWYLFGFSIVFVLLWHGFYFGLKKLKK